MCEPTVSIDLTLTEASMMSILGKIGLNVVTMKKERVIELVKICELMVTLQPNTCITLGKKMHGLDQMTAEGMEKELIEMTRND